MSINLEQILIFVGAFLLGIIIYGLIMRSRTQLIIENEKSKLTTQIQLTQQKLEKLQEYYVKLHKSAKVTRNRLTIHFPYYYRCWAEKNCRARGAVNYCDVRIRSVRSYIRISCRTAHDKNHQ